MMTRTVSFKKKTKLTSRTQVRKREYGKDASGETDGDGGHRDASTYDKIQSSRKKRKVLQSTLYKRGVNAIDLMKGKEVSRKTGDNSKPSSDSTSDLNTSFGSGGPMETILEKKHQAAMEDYITAKMKNQEKSQGVHALPEKNSEHQSEEKQLYQQLSRHAAVPSLATTTQEQDVGAGGTVLSGTGMMEVILPSSYKHETHKETEIARQTLPTQFGRVKPYSSASREATGVEHLNKSFSQNYRKPRAVEPQPIQEKDEVTVDRDRLGFQAARFTTSHKPTKKSYEPSSDDRVAKHFIKKERMKQK